MLSKQDLHTYRDTSRVLLRADEFICLRPHLRLSAYISNYNITFPTKTLLSGITTIPSGCATLTIEQDDSRIAITLDGPATKPYIELFAAAEGKQLVSIEFKPAGLYALTGIRQSELVDLSIDFEAVNPKLSKLISEALEQAGSVRELINGLDSVLLGNMYGACHPQLNPALQNIVHAAGNIAVKRLSDEIHYSERQLNRLFKEHVGVSAKSFSRLVRINKSFRLLKKPQKSLTLISDVMGFHDLAHFIHDFKSVCGVTPGEYRNKMSDFYINTTKF